MIAISQRYHSIFSTETGGMTTNLLRGHDEASKQEARQAVNILKQYKLKCHEFTEEIIELWPLPRKVMERYQINDVEALNEWLDDQR